MHGRHFGSAHHRLAFILLEGGDIHVAHRRIWSWIVSISLRCSVRRSASIVSPGWSMRRPALTAHLSVIADKHGERSSAFAQVGVIPAAVVLWYLTSEKPIPEALMAFVRRSTDVGARRAGVRIG